VFYRQTNAADIFGLAQEKVKKFFPTEKEFTPTNILVATWHLQNGQEVSTSFDRIFINATCTYM